MGVIDIFGFGEGGWGLAMLRGAGMTLLVSACGLLIGAVIGALVAWARLSKHRLAGAAGEAYAALFRGLPELLVVYFVYFGSSTLLTGLANFVGYEGFVGVPAFLAGSLAVGVISGSYQAEVFRAAYLAIAKGRARGGGQRRHGPISHVPPDHRAAGSALRSARPRQPVAGGAEGTPR